MLSLHTSRQSLHTSRQSLHTSIQSLHTSIQSLHTRRQSLHMRLVHKIYILTRLNWHVTGQGSPPPNTHTRPAFCFDFFLLKRNIYCFTMLLMPCFYCFYIALYDLFQMTILQKKQKCPYCTVCSFVHDSALQVQIYSVPTEVPMPAYIYAMLSHYSDNYLQS